MSDLQHNATIAPDCKKKECEQCHDEKDIDLFRKVTNQYTGVHPMSICKECYNSNNEARKRKQEEEWQQNAEERKQRLAHIKQWEEWQREREEREERERARQQMLEAWYQQQPDRPCVACKQLLPANAFGVQLAPSDDGTSWVPKALYTRCILCDEKIRIERSIPCCICQQKKGNALVHYRDYATWGGGTAIRLFCRDCEKAFLALPPGQQAFYIRTRCNLAFPAGQVIYGLVDPESPLIYRYVGRTHDQKKRLQKHIQDHWEESVLIGPEEKSYYSRANWVHDLYLKGLRPSMQILREVEVAPQSIEWETRYILHGIQQRWPLTNSEANNEEFVAHVRSSKLDFLHCSFEDLVQAHFVREKGIEAFVRAFYR